MFNIVAKMATTTKDVQLTATIIHRYFDNFVVFYSRSPIKKKST